MLNGPDLVAFLTAQTVHVFDPDTRAYVAEAVYHPDGKVEIRHADGRTDRGAWGADGHLYWTRYEAFRDGTRNSFFLEPLDAATAQAFFSDGRRAFLQSHKAALSDDA